MHLLSFVTSGNAVSRNANLCFWLVFNSPRLAIGSPAITVRVSDTGLAGTRMEQTEVVDEKLPDRILESVSESKQETRDEMLSRHRCVFFSFHLLLPDTHAH